MKDSDNVLELLLDLPEAFQIMEKAQKRLLDEQNRRENFYNEITEDIKAEFINGEVIVHSPVKSHHAMISDNAFSLFRFYVQKKDLGRVTHEKVMSRFTRNDYEPDVMYFSKEKADTIKPNQSLFPVPDFIIEILSDGTKERDRGVKFRDYEAHSVGEYWIIDAENAYIEQYVLKNGNYELIKKTDEGIIHCTAINGFDVPVKAVFDENENMKFIQSMV
jgi:Uma2 family endonuclease